ncbi:hypothetical protein KAK07_09275 [Ideonella sp. 4Y16]|uniref:hypothetical protein n=1 Tax=Ideonella alba TaxID=2824118 RepID=UPI001B35992F|nr:hypothetical protein [Ideonella alba]MBQ0943526.1 hypothetical protein [Ideonella alba]
MKTKILLGLSLAALTSFAQAAIPKDISFDGYCDGMTFTKNGDGTVSGSSIGCVTDPVHGFMGKVKTQGPAYIVTAYGVVFTGSAALTFIIRDDGTWAIERADGTGTPVNSGTWTAGAPASRATKAAGQQ